MQPIAIKDILDGDKYSDQEILKCVSGRITTLYDAKTGTGSKGDWEFQNGILKDSTGEIKICFSSCSQPKGAKGKSITLTSKKTEKHGWQGVKIDDTSYENKEGKKIEERTLRITGSADIVYEGGEPSSGGESKSSKQSGQSSGNSSVDHPQVVLEDMIAMHRKCFVMVVDAYGSMNLPPEVISSFTATMFIEGTKRGLGSDFAKRIGVAIPKSYPPAPKDPKNWKECVIPKGANEGKTLAEIPDEPLLKLFEYYDSKESNTDFAECVYQAAKDRDILPKQGKEEKPEDDFPE